MEEITDEEEEPTRKDWAKLSQLWADPMTPKLLEALEKDRMIDSIMCAKIQRKK